MKRKTTLILLKKKMVFQFSSKTSILIIIFFSAGLFGGRRKEVEERGLQKRLQRMQAVGGLQRLPPRRLHIQHQPAHQGCQSSTQAGENDLILPRECIKSFPQGVYQILSPGSVSYTVPKECIRYPPFPGSFLSLAVLGCV